MKTKTYRIACLGAMMLSVWTAMPALAAATEPASPTKMEQQDDKIKGNVSDADGGLIGASVKIKDTNVGTLTATSPLPQRRATCLSSPTWATRHRKSQSPARLSMF